MDPVDDDINYRLGVFYFNRNDPRTIVPKRLRHFGFTLNFARPWSYAFLVWIAAMVAFLVFMIWRSQGQGMLKSAARQSVACERCMSLSQR